MIGWKVNDDDEQTRANIHALSGIRTHGLSVQAINAYTSDRAATGTGYCLVTENTVALGGLVVIILVIGPNARRFKHGRGRCIFSGDKNA
jgi:hypothetical protein